jgi:hypothetical protein
LQQEFHLETIFDWLTVIIFSGLIVLFLQRSKQENPQDNLWQYLGASVGCATANYFGNEGYEILAVLIIGALLAFIWYVLKPLEGWGKDH